MILAALVGVLIGFVLRAWLVMLALGIVDVNASWGESLLATLLLGIAFTSVKKESAS